MRSAQELAKFKQIVKEFRSAIEESFLLPPKKEPDKGKLAEKIKSSYLMSDNEERLELLFLLCEILTEPFKGKELRDLNNWILNIFHELMKELNEIR